MLGSPIGLNLSTWEARTPLATKTSSPYCGSKVNCQARGVPLGFPHLSLTAAIHTSVQSFPKSTYIASLGHLWEIIHSTNSLLTVWSSISTNLSWTCLSQRLLHFRIWEQVCAHLTVSPFPLTAFVWPAALLAFFLEPCFCLSQACPTQELPQNLMWPRVALHVDQHKTINCLKTLRGVGVFISVFLWML